MFTTNANTENLLKRIEKLLEEKAAILQTEKIIDAITKNINAGGPIKRVSYALRRFNFRRRLTKKHP
jgi:hypothetical protein